MNERANLSLSPIKVLKKSELIAIELRKRIIRGQLKEGDNLPSEAELIEQFGISRPTLREALRILEADSLITVRRGSRGGPVVHLPGPDLAARHFGLVLQAQDTSLADVYRVRQLIEPPAVRMVTETPASQKRAPAFLQDIIDCQKQAVKDRDMEAISEHTTRFHEGIVELTDNKTLLLITQMLNDVYYKHMSGKYGVVLDAMNDKGIPKSVSKAIKANEHLVSLIEAGDADAATDYWRLHLAGVRKVLFSNDQTKSIIDVLD